MYHTYDEIESEIFSKIVVFNSCHQIELSMIPGSKLGQV